MLDLQLEHMVSYLFISRTEKVNKDWIRVPGTVFKYKKGAEYLSHQPKLERSCTILPNKKHKIMSMRPKTDSVKKALSGFTEDSECDEDYLHNYIKRPMGIKKRDTIQK